MNRRRLGKTDLQVSPVGLGCMGFSHAYRQAVEKKEAGIMKDILEKGTYIRPWVDELLKTIGCEIV